MATTLMITRSRTGRAYKRPSYRPFRLTNKSTSAMLTWQVHPEKAWSKWARFHATLVKQIAQLLRMTKRSDGHAHVWSCAGQTVLSEVKTYEPVGVRSNIMAQVLHQPGLNFPEEDGDPGGKQRIPLEDADTTSIDDMPWSISALVAACTRKGIHYQESSVLSSFRGVIVTSGSTSRISIRAGLQESEKIAAVAHELAHRALGHNRAFEFLWEGTPADESAIDKAHEADAAIWAAHLLMDSKVKTWERNLAEAITNTHKRSFQPAAIEHKAAQLTAIALNIPLSTVECWLRTRGHSYQESPQAWLERPEE